MAESGQEQPLAPPHCPRVAPLRLQPAWLMMGHNKRAFCDTADRVGNPGVLVLGLFGPTGPIGPAAVPNSKMAVSSARRPKSQFPGRFPPLQPPQNGPNARLGAEVCPAVALRGTVWATGSLGEEPNPRNGGSPRRPLRPCIRSCMCWAQPNCTEQQGWSAYRPGSSCTTAPDEGGGHCLLGWWGASKPWEQLHKLLLQQPHGVTFGGSRVSVGAGVAWVN